MFVHAGDGGVGKSCLMNRFVSNQFDENSFHTIGVEFLNKDVEIDDVNYTLQVNVQFKRSNRISYLLSRWYIFRFGTQVTIATRLLSHSATTTFIRKF